MRVPTPTGSCSRDFADFFSSLVCRTSVWSAPMSRVTLKWRGRCLLVTIGSRQPWVVSRGWRSRFLLLADNSFLQHLRCERLGCSIALSCKCNNPGTGCLFILRRFRPGFHLDGALITASAAGIVGFARAASMDIALATSFTVAMLGMVRVPRK